MENDSITTEPDVASVPEISPQGQSPKSFTKAFWLSFLLGGIGADRFYLGYTGLGILKLITGGGLGVWAYVDSLRLAFGKYGDRSGLPLAGYEQNQKWAKALSLVQIVVFALIIVFVVYELHKLFNLYDQVNNHMSNQ